MVQKDLKSISFFFLQMMIVWVFAWGLFYFLRQCGIDEYNYVEFSYQPKRLLHTSIHIGVGVLTGSMYGVSELFFEKKYFRQLPYGRLILTKTVIYFFIALILMTAAVTTNQYFVYGKLNGQKLIGWLTSKNFLVALTHFMTVSILISFIRQMNYKFGPGVLWNMLLGRYHRPREEERIFMFLDLKSSTTIAEKLGHIRFSRLIQDCFFDLTDVVLRHQVDIYQYVGDEAILSWSLEKGLESNHCLHSYFDFMEVLFQRASYYDREYGIQPFFKVGVHLGVVTVAEVGVIKKEIAYHGDVLNTAARIQGRCNELEQGLLISGEVREKLPMDKVLRSEDMGVEVLKGKVREVAIFRVEKFME